MNPQACLSVLLVLCCGAVSAQTAIHPCGELANAFGPFDYRRDRDKFTIVETSHFTPRIETLVHGRSGTLGRELDYTLRAVPNHHRALVSVMRYGEKLKTPQPYDLRYPVECYFDRALRFRPDDGIARMLYVQYLIRNDRKEEARAQLAVVAAAAQDNPFTHYNLGLAYVDLKLYDDALKHAHRAHALGMDKAVGLRESLRAAGKWVEPAEKPASSADEPQSAASAAADSKVDASEPREE